MQGHVATQRKYVGPAWHERMLHGHDVAAAALVAALLLTVITGSGPSARAQTIADEQWPAYRRDPRGMRHSPVVQVNRANVARLQLAWTYRTGELATYQGAKFADKAAFEATPIMVDDVLYFSTATARVFALDARSGQERWVYDPKIDRSVDYSNPVSRGVSTWAAPDDLARRTIFVGTVDGRLIALDAATGKPRADFGQGGMVDLATGAQPFGNGRIEAGQYQVTSPPAVINDLVVVGTSIGDNRAVREERGVVRAYDARSGALRWSWDPVPRAPGEP